MASNICTALRLPAIPTGKKKRAALETGGVGEAIVRCMFQGYLVSGPCVAAVGVGDCLLFDSVQRSLNALELYIAESGPVSDNLFSRSFSAGLSNRTVQKSRR